jgi:hypothetical protein
MHFFFVFALVMGLFSQSHAASSVDERGIETAIQRISAANSIEDVVKAIKGTFVVIHSTSDPDAFSDVNRNFVDEVNKVDSSYRKNLLETSQKYQGWKLHVSAAYGQELRVLKLAVPFLLQQKVYFKIANSKTSYQIILGGDKAQKGKLITIYPIGDEKAYQLAQQLDDLFTENDFNTTDFMKPHYENSFGNSGAVSYRFGLYSNIPIIQKPHMSKFYRDDIKECGFLIQKANRKDYYPFLLDFRILKSTPFIATPFPKVLPVNWVTGIDEMIRKELYFDAQIALCTGEGLGGIRQAPITERELPIFFEKIKELQYVYNIRFLLHPFMFTVQRKKHEILHNLVCAALIYMSRNPQITADFFMNNIVNNNSDDYLKYYHVSYTKAEDAEYHSDLGDTIRDGVQIKEIPFRQLFEENTEFGDFDTFLKDNNVEATINYYFGKMKAYYDENGWPEKK